MDDYITPKLPNRIIPVSKGCDQIILVRRVDPETDVPVDWGADVFILIDNDPKQPMTRIEAVIDTSLATIRLESDVCDTVKTGSTWRIGMSETSDPTLETPVLVGTFERNDGK